MATTRSRQAKTDAELDSAIADLYAGVPDIMTDPGRSATPIQFEAIDAPLRQLEDGKVLLTNTYWPEEEVFFTGADGKWNGKKAVFSGGHYIATPTEAEMIKRAAPYVYQENPEGQWLKHKESGFTTTNSEAWQDYIQRWNANR